MGYSNAEIEVLAACGGRPRSEGGQEVWDFGLRASDPALQGELLPDGTPLFVPHDPGEDVPEIAGDKVALWKFAFQANGGRHPAYSWQQTGSCVNSGFQNAMISRVGVECMLRPEPEVFARPFTLACYGYSRYLMGDQGQGEGSSGDLIAKAGGVVGACQFGAAGARLPAFSEYDAAFTTTSKVELQYSSWRLVPEDVRAACKPHTVQYVVVKTADEAEAEIRRCRPLTWAGNWGSTMQMQYRGAGENKVLWGTHAAAWNHQESVHGVWHHPTLGRIWYVMNNWYMLANGVAVPVHGRPANDEPPGGYWISDADMKYQLAYRFGEVRAIKDVRGYDEGKLSLLAV